MSDERNADASRSKHDPVTGDPEGLPDAFGEDPDEKQPLVGDPSIDPEDHEQ